MAELEGDKMRPGPRNIDEEHVRERPDEVGVKGRDRLAGQFGQLDEREHKDGLGFAAKGQRGLWRDEVEHQLRGLGPLFIAVALFGEAFLERLCQGA